MLNYVVKTEAARYTAPKDKIKALHDWVCNKVNYAYKADGKTSENSLEVKCDSSVFFRNTTVCDGYARALTLLLEKAGFEAYHVASQNHAWTMVKLGNKYYHIDACHDDNNDGTINYSHYLVSDADIKKCQNGHKNWRIVKLSNRFDYNIPATIPTCNETLGG